MANVQYLISKDPSDDINLLAEHFCCLLEERGAEISGMIVKDTPFVLRMEYQLVAREPLPEHLKAIFKHSKLGEFEAVRVHSILESTEV